MKKLIFALLAVAFLSLPAPAAAEQGKAAPSAEAPAKDRAPRKEMTFEEKKAKAIARAQKRLSCLQAAQTPEALRACSPRHHGKRRRGGDGSAPKKAE